MADPIIFISHCSADRHLAEALAELFQRALALQLAEIRCTSVEGYRFQPGIRFEDTIRAELKSAKAFVAIPTQNSLRSTYVLFELGARWGAEGKIVPVVGPGLVAGDLQPPVSEWNHLNSQDETDVMRLVSHVSHLAGCTLQDTSTYIERVKTVANTRVEVPGRSLSERHFRIVADNTHIAVTLVDDDHLDLVIIRLFTIEAQEVGRYEFRRTLVYGMWVYGTWGDCSLRLRRHGQEGCENINLEFRENRTEVRVRQPLQLGSQDRLEGYLQSTERIAHSRGFYQLAYNTYKAPSQFRWSRDSTWKPSTLDVFFFSEDLAARPVPEDQLVQVPASLFGVNYVLRWNGPAPQRVSKRQLGRKRP